MARGQAEADARRLAKALFFCCFVGFGGAVNSGSLCLVVVSGPTGFGSHVRKSSGHMHVVGKSPESRREVVGKSSGH